MRRPFLRSMLLALLCLGPALAAEAGPPKKPAAKPAAAKPAKAPKAPKTVDVWVMPVRLKGEGISPETAKVLGAALVAELKDLGIFKVLGGEPIKAKVKALKDKKVLVPGCEEKKACVQVVGRQLKAKVFYHLQIARAQEGVTLTMRTFDVKSGKEVRKAVERADESPEDLQRAARWATRQVSSPMVTTLLKGKGRLTVSASEGGANLYLNGKSFGKNLGKPFKVSAGVFDVQVKKEGFDTFHDVVVVRPDQDLALQAVLAPIDRRAAPADAVAAAGTPPPDEAVPDVTGEQPGAKPAEKPAEQPVEKPAEKPKEDLPAWAIFDKNKPRPAPVEHPPAAGGGETSKPAEKPVKTAVVVTPDEGKPDFLPADRPADVEAERDDDEVAVYETWWFWTIIGAVVVGGAVTAGVLLGTGDGGQDTGSAVLSWQ